MRHGLEADAEVGDGVDQRAATTAPTALIGGRGRRGRRRARTSSAPRSAGGAGDGQLGRARQRRRPAAPGVRRRLRPGRRDRAARGDEGDASGCRSSRPACTPRPPTTAVSGRRAMTRPRRSLPVIGAGRGEPEPCGCSSSTTRRPAREELAFLLRQDPRVGTVRCARRARPQALKLPQRRAASTWCSATSRCPGWTAWSWPGCVSRFADRPQIVFVTAYDDHAVDAFDLQATDYVMKPVRAEPAGRGGAPRRARPAPGASRRPRTRRSRSSWPASPGSCAARRCATSRRTATTPGCTPPPAATCSGSRSRCSRSAGPTAGFVRIHRSTLVALAHVDEVRAVGRAMQRAARRATCCRSAAGTPASCATGWRQPIGAAMTEQQPPAGGCGSPTRAPRRPRRAPARPASRARSTSRPSSARCTCAR